jgi:hypothetical protein
LTLSMSPGLKSCVRNQAIPSSVSARNTFFTPSGVSPFQPGPATRKLPPSLPVVRLPM